MLFESLRRAQSENLKQENDDDDTVDQVHLDPLRRRGSGIALRGSLRLQAEGHRGRSVRRAREGMQVTEYGLGAVAVGIMLLTHPERLMNYDDLYVDCAGDEYAPEADGGFSYAPLFCFSECRVRVGASWFGGAGDVCGSSSAFLPQ